MGGVPLISHAGYAQLSPPPGFGSVAGGFGYATAASDTIAGQLVRQSGGLTANVGGQAVKMDVAYRFASNAPRIAAAAIFLNPYVRTGVGIATWLGVAGVIWSSVDNMWGKAELPSGSYQSDGYQWDAGPGCVLGDPISAAKCRFVSIGGNLDTVTGASVQYDAPGHALVTLNRTNGSTNQIGATRGVNSCPSGWYVTPAGCVQTPPLKQLTQQEMADLLNPANQPGWPMPDTVPRELPPGTLLPVQQPVVNPSTGVNPFPQPLFVPSGNPLPNPNFDSNSPVSPSNQPFVQPGVRVVPTPTPSSPWQVDMQPVDRPVSSSQPSPESQTETTAPESDVQKEETPDLCKTNPDILACQKPELDTPEGEIPESSKDVSLNEENLFGGGSCPADLYFTPHGLQQLKVWDWNNACGYITSYVKPILIICCTFAAFMILIPGRTE